MSKRLFIVFLRRPGKSDGRADPFWEFGSFGCTGCHSHNLLNPAKEHVGDGDRLAFVQGGHLGSRLLLITPPVERVEHGNAGACTRVELRWKPAQKPFRYDYAPSLFESPAPGRTGLFPMLAKSLGGTNRTTWDGKFASRFRSRARPLELELARELESVFQRAVSKAKSSDFIRHYSEALPWIDASDIIRNRRSTYQSLLRELDRHWRVRCRPKRKAGCK